MNKNIKNFQLYILNLSVTLLILVFSLIALAPVASAHGGGGEDYLPAVPPGGVAEKLETQESSSSILPYAIGGSIVIVGGVAGLAVWQRRKNS